MKNEVDLLKCPMREKRMMFHKTLEMFECHSQIVVDSYKIALKSKNIIFKFIIIFSHPAKSG